MKFRGMQLVDKPETGTYVQVNVSDLSRKVSEKAFLFDDKTKICELGLDKMEDNDRYCREYIEKAVD